MRIEIDTENFQIPMFDVTSFDVYCGGVVVLILVVVWLYILTKIQTKQLAKEAKLQKGEGYEHI